MMNELTTMLRKNEKGSFIHIDFISIKNNNLDIEGYVIASSVKSINKIYLVANERKYEAELMDRQKMVFSIDNNTSYITAFKGKIILDKSINNYEINICCRSKDDIVIEKLSMSFGRFAPIGNEIKNAYWHKERYLLYTDSYSLFVSKCGVFKRLISEMRFIISLLAIREKHAIKAIAVRCMCHLLRPLIRKDIWLISDREDRADDNGEALFCYMSENKDNRVKCYYAIRKNCIDVKRLVKYGKVIEFGGWQHKFFMVLGAYIISSHDRVYPDIFDIKTVFYRDLLNDTKFIFLQHGVIKDDLSKWLNKYEKNIDLFIATTKPEHRSILEYSYYYSKCEIKMTGLPRYDLLYSDPQKYITVMPTWRSYLAELLDDNEESEGIQTGFFESAYFKFYNSLLNSTELLSEADRYGYSVCFMAHPNMQRTLKLFDKNSNVIFFDLLKPYRDIFAESDMIITDYSSVAFDFAYLRKPLIYTQFDVGEFFCGAHSYVKGYFDYERDGFGEVETTLEATVSRIVEYMKGGCALKDKYRKRIDNTFAFNDKNNCERVFNAIKNLRK